MSQSNIFQPETEPDLSIVIVNWNTRDLLAQCLESVVATPHLQIPDSVNQSGILHLPPFTLEVWVVDNCSTDGSAQMVQARFPWVRLVENQENIGFAPANNQVIRKSEG